MYHELWYNLDSLISVFMSEQPKDLQAILTDALKKAGEQGLLEGISNEELARMTIQARTKAAVQDTGVLNVESVNLEEIKQKFIQAEAEYKQVIEEYDNANRDPAIYRNEELYNPIKARALEAHAHRYDVLEQLNPLLARAWNAWRDGGPRPEEFKAFQGRYDPLCYFKLGNYSGFVFPDLDVLGNDFRGTLLGNFDVPNELRVLGIKNLKLVKPAFFPDLSNMAIGGQKGELGRK